jgi:type IV secretion system protein VirB10
VGGIAGAASGHALSGLGYGALAGGVAGAVYSIFTHNNDLTLEQGQTIEMVLQRPLELQESNLAGVTGSGPVPVPQSEQQLPMQKPSHEHVLCPVGALGCT